MAMLVWKLVRFRRGSAVKPVAGSLHDYELVHAAGRMKGMAGYGKRPGTPTGQPIKPVHLMTSVLTMVVLFTLTQLRPLVDAPKEPAQLYRSVTKPSHRAEPTTPILSAAHVLSDMSAGDDSAAALAAESRPKRICLVTYEVAGPHLNGGIGTAFTNLALALSKQGHTVRHSGA